jgi:hypothetical protein
MLTLQTPYPQFFDKAGKPLDAGYVYIGTAGANPQTSPITVYWDQALTQPVAQPLRTAAGHIARSGTPARVFVNADDYAILVQTSTGVQVAYEQNASRYGVTPITGGGTGATTKAGAQAALSLVPGVDVATSGANTFTGAQTLPGNAVNPLEAVPKQQLDSALTIYRRFGSSGVKTPTTATNLVTGIPTWAKRVTVVLNGMSTNGSSGFALTLGASAGLEATGYTAMSTSVSGGGAVTPTSSTSAFVSDNGGATGTSFGKVEFFLNSANAWVCSGHLHRITTSSFSLLGGSKTLAGALDRIQFSAVNGTDVFDAGSYEVIWEG